ncbi:hypothetical protein VTH82DRAFT_3527 [Thermothelomyces myriococcoides]
MPTRRHGSSSMLRSCRHVIGSAAISKFRPEFLRRTLSFPATRALLVCGLLWLLAFAYGSLFLWRDPHSAYFRSEGVYDLDYSATRQAEARAFLEQVSAEVAAAADTKKTQGDDGKAKGGQTKDDGAAVPKPRPKAGPTPTMCVAFATVRREGDVARQYLADAVGSMLASLDPRERAAMHVKLLFANTDPAQHPDWGAPWVDALVDDASGYRGLTDLERAGLRKAEEERDVQLKGNFDYMYLLERCLEDTDAPFIAVFEDDIVFSADWAARTLRGLQYLVRDHKKAEGNDNDNDDNRDWLYMRLFYTETHLGWVHERDWWYNHLPLTLAIAAGCSALVLVLLRLASHYCCCCSCCSGGNRLRLDWATIAVVSLVVAPAFTALTFMAGKHNLPLPGYSLHHPSVPFSPPGSALAAGVTAMDKNACCTQALVFHRPAVPGLIKNLRELERGQTDLMIEDYCDAVGLRRFALREQAVQHVGLVSSRGMRVADARSVWAFWFEANRPEAVEKSHREVLEEIDWAMFEKLATPARAGE